MNSTKEMQAELTRSRAKSFSFSMALILIVLYIVLLNLGDLNFFAMNGDLLIKAGANFGPLTISEKEYYRLLTYSFLHASILHLLCNAYFLYEFGPLAEAALGKNRYIFIYILASILGGLTSILFDPLRTSVGASAAIAGVLGAYITVSWLKREKAILSQRISKAQIVLLLIFLFYGFLLGLTSEFMDNAAHLAGFFTGILAALLLTAGDKASRQGSKNWRFTLAAAAALISLCPLLTELAGKRLENNEQVEKFLIRKEASQLLREKKFLHGLTKVEDGLQKFPNDLSLLSARGQALVELERFEKADKDLSYVLSKEPNNQECLKLYSLLQARMNNFKRAIEVQERLLKLAPRDAMALNNLAWYSLNFFKDPQSLERADKAISKSLKIDGGLLTAYDTRGTYNIITGNYAKARADLEKCLGDKQARSAALFHLAIIDKLEGKEAAAQEKMADSQTKEYKPEKFEIEFLKEKLPGFYIGK